MQIFCDVVMFINFALATAWLVYDIAFRFPKKCKEISLSNKEKDGSVDKYKLFTFQNEICFILLRQLLPAAIAIITCIFDGVTGILPGDGDQPYLLIFVWIYLGFYVSLFLGLTIFFQIMQDKYEFHYTHPRKFNRGSSAPVAAFVGLIYSIIPALSIYTIVLMCIL